MKPRIIREQSEDTVKRLVVLLLATTGLSGCDNKELDRCKEKADMRYQGCVSKPLIMQSTCDFVLESQEKRCEREHGSKADYDKRRR